MEGRIAMDKIFVQEEFVNETEGYRSGESDPFESRFESAGEAFKYYRKEFGRPVSKIYVDTPEGSRAIGWVFVKRVKYDDCKDTFLQAAWITLHSGPCQHKTIYHYL
jgi:hypothetical protein